MTNISYIYKDFYTHRLEKVDGDNAIALCGQAFDKALVSDKPENFYGQCQKCRMEAARRMWTGQQIEAKNDKKP